LEEQVKARTQELQVQKEEILTQNEELHQQQEEIIAQRDHIDEKNQELQRVNEMTTDSIRYARTIQNALFPKSDNWKNLFAQLDVLYRPKDIVSGDFFWYKEVGNYFWAVVADCTGHGVPGAFMSLVGLNLLQNIIAVKGVTEPSQVLEEMNARFKERLNQAEGHNSDGIDLSLCRFQKLNNGKMELVYAGAKRPLIVFSPDLGMGEIQGTKKSIGGLGKKEREFESRSLNLSKNSLIVLYSDGIVDQNDPDRKKFGTPRFKEIIEQSYPEKAKNLVAILESELDRHAKNEPSRDDITVMCILI
jgi:serine phosphatase RsbU (regulator of sigma subunit)